MTTENTDTDPAYVPSDTTNFAVNLRLKREALGLSQGDIVTKMQELGWTKFNQMAVSRIEQGKRRVDLSEARSLASIVGGNINEMVNLPEAVSAANSIFDAQQRCRAAVSGIAASFHDSQVSWDIARHVVQREVSQEELERVKGLIPEAVAKSLQLAYEEVQEAAKGGVPYFLKLGQEEFNELMSFESGVQLPGEGDSDQS